MDIAASDRVASLSDDDPDAFRLLMLLAQLAPEPFPASVLVEHVDLLPPELAESLSDPDARERSVAALVEHELLEVVDGRWELDEDAAVDLREASSDAERREATGVALQLMRAAFPADADAFPQWEVSEPLLPHVVAVATRAADLGTGPNVAAWLLERAAALLDEQGQTRVARDVAERAVEVADEGDDLLVRGTARRTLATVQSERGDYVAAQATLATALELHEALGEDGRIEAARDRTVLAFALFKVERWDDARTTIGAALDVLDADVDGDAHALVHALMMQGHLLVTLRDWDGARDTYAAASELAERELAGHQAVLSAFGGLGVALHNLGAHDEAVAALQRALDLAEVTIGDGHPSTAVIRSHLSDALLGAEHLAEARTHVERALELGERTLAEGHPDLRIRHRKLASLAKRQGDLETAREQMEAALAIAEASPAIKPPDVVADLLELADVRGDLGDRSAIALYERALKVVEESGAATDQDVASYRLLAGRCAREFGELGIAAGHFRAALALFERLEERGRAGAVVCRVGLGQIARDLGGQLADVELALGDAGRASDSRTAAAAAYAAVLEQELAGDHVETLVAVASAAIEGGELALAEHGLARAAEIAADDEQARPRVAVAWSHLGRAHRDGGALDSAERAFRAALPLLEDEPWTQGVILHDLGDVRRLQDRWDDAADLYGRAVERKRAATSVKARDLATSLNVLALALIELERAPAAAEAAIEAASLLGPEGDDQPRLWARSLALAGRALAVAGELEQALELLEQSCRTFADERVPAGERAAAVGLLAAVSVRLGDEDRGRRLLVDELDRSDADSALVLAEACRELGELALAELGLERAQEAALTGGPELSADVTPRQIGLGWHRLGRAQMDAKAYDDAWRVHSRALPLLTTAPHEHGVVLHDLADVRNEQDDMKAALGLYQRAAELKRMDTDPDNRHDLAVTLLELGRALRKNDRLDEARDVFDEQLAVLAALPQREPFSEGLALHGIGEVLSNQQRWTEAIAFFERALSRKQEADDANPSSIAATLLDLGRAYEADGNLDAALPAFQQRMEVLAGLEDRDLYEEGVTLHDIGDVLRTQGKSDEAADLYQQALDRKRSAPDDDQDPEDIAVTLLSLSATAVERKDPEAGEAFAREAAELLEQGDDDDPEHSLRVANAKILIASAKRVAGDGPEALALFEEAERIAEPLATVKPLEVAQIKELLAEACATEGRNEAAEQARAEAESLKGGE
jgi:tetratricopeptide (TPR) repeat protein